MSGFTDYLEKALLNHIFTDPAFTPPATLYVGLSSTTPAEDGSGVTEPSTGSYARVATTAADWSAATGTAPATKTNTATLTFPTATGAWLSGANLTYGCLFDAISAGNLLAFGAVAAPAPVATGQHVTILPGDLVIKLGDPGDTY